MTLYKHDLHRYFGDKKIPLIDVLLPPPQLKYLKVFRKAQESHGILKKIYAIRLAFIQRKTDIQIPYQTQIGKGFYIGHWGRIIINSGVTIGNNCNIATGVTIGQANRGKKKGVPVIGNSVWIGTNAVIVGGITIGNDVMIALNAFVNIDVPDHSIVVGNPATIHPNDNATAGYIDNIV